MSCDAVAYRSLASTTLLRSPARIRATAAETARCHCGAVRLPSCQRSPARRLARGREGATAACGSPMVVSQERPEPRPSTAAGTTRTEPSEVGSKVKLPNATGPQPGRPTSSVTSAPSNSSISHFSPAVNRSSPAGMLTRAASPQPTSPSPPPDPGHRTWGAAGGRPGRPDHRRGPSGRPAGRASAGSDPRAGLPRQTTLRAVTAEPGRGAGVTAWPRSANGAAERARVCRRDRWGAC